MRGPSCVCPLLAERMCTAIAVVITTMMECAFYGKNTSSAAAGGIVLVKIRRALVVATYSDPVTAAEAIPYVHSFADNLEALTTG